MKVVKFCLLPLLALLVLGGAGLYFYAKDLPTEWNVDQSIEIAAPASEIHPLIEDLHRWPEWSAFKEQYPETAYEFAGAEKGEGAIMTTSNDGGSVRVTITASDPAKGVWFDELIEAQIEAKGAILYEEADGKTTVRWQDHGTFGDFFLLRFANKAFEVAFSDGVSRNLESLKRAVEGS